MFSVDNFYDFFVHEYGHEKTNNLVMIFRPHGAKDLHNLEPFAVTQSDFNKDFISFKRIVMHDQEPLDLNYMDTYRKTLCDQKNLLIQGENQRKAIEFNLKKHANDCDVFEFMRLVMEDRPIICHSELNSQDIRILNEHGFVDCYYWWHGLTARDWFRHWEHYQDLAPIDKSNCQHRFLLYSRAQDGTRIYRKELLAHCRQYQNMIRHNWDGTQVDPTYSAKIDIPDAVDSAVHLVAETLFDTDKIYLTEKVFKPMVMSQPFILFAPPGSLQYLKDYGFKTFDHCWDESYDHETDSTKRMSLLLELIDQLANMSQDKFQDLYQQALPVIEHNRKRFFSKEFQDDLLLELRTNMDRALLEQNQGH